MGIRVDNWQSVLGSELRKKRDFVYGFSDCAFFAFDVVKAITGVDLGEVDRGTYSTPFGAKKIIKKKGYGDIRGWVSCICESKGFDSISVTMAKRGDLVMCLDPEEGQCVGVMSGDSGIFVTPEGDYVTVPRHELTDAWSTS